jgi:DNA polymerase V
MFALADANNFFCSCERLFRPDLQNKPVLVLSNNDGCVIARSNEVKKLGIKMGEPAFKIKEQIIKHGITVFSSNYTLYGDLSKRIMSMLATFVPEIEVYSIDEAFLNFSGLEHFDLYQYGRQIVETTSKGTGIPISLGIAPTKTLAKVANKYAKKYPAYHSVCLIDTDEKRIKALKLFDISDVWGIGRKHAKFLAKYNIKTAYDFIQMPRKWARAQMTIAGEKIWCELNGEACIEFDPIIADKKQICVSRSFGQPVTELSDLKTAVTTFASLAAQQLRQQQSIANSMTIFLQTNYFRPELPQHNSYIEIKLLTATDSTLEIVKSAIDGLEKLYKANYQFKKAGVILQNITSKDARQQSLFHNIDYEKHSKLMTVIDNWNSGFNEQIKLASQINDNNNWKLKRTYLSPSYTTDWKDIIKVKSSD